MASTNGIALGHLLQPDDAPVATACHAPFSTIFFDTTGNARPCCRNVIHSLGDVRQHSIREIWDGAANAQLRAAMVDHDFSLGCQWCSIHEEHGDAAHVYSRLFDRYAPSVATPEWPRRMEFSLSSVCNLECVMCHGDLSSTIRRKRDKLPPLPVAYGDEFFDELAAFVPHLEHAGFAGGEPFLAKEAFRVFDLLIELAPHVRCNVATNGTVWTPRVTRVLESLLVDVAVSIDGGSADTFERIRVGARFDDVVANLDRFQAMARERGTSIEIDHCLMPQNVDTFFELLLLAEERGIRVAVNAVRDPISFSLDHLDRAPMGEALASLELQAETWAHRLPINGAALVAEAERVRRRVALVAGGGHFPELVGAPTTPTLPVLVPNTRDTPELLGLPRHGDGPADAAAAGELVRAHTGAEAHCLVVDDCELLVDVPDRTAAFLGVDVSAWLGRPLTDLMPIVMARFGTVLGEERLAATPDVTELDVLLQDRRVRVVEAVSRDAGGEATGGVIWFSG